MSIFHVHIIYYRTILPLILNGIFQFLSIITQKENHLDERT